VGRDAVGTQHTAERRDEHRAGAGLAQRRCCALRPRAAHIEVVEQQDPTTPDRASGLARSDDEAPGVRGHVPERPCRAGRVGSLDGGGCPRGTGNRLADAGPESVDPRERRHACARGRGDGDDHVDGATRNGAQLRCGVREELTAQGADHCAEVSALLGHGRLFVSEERRVQRARDRAEAGGKDRHQREPEAPRHDVAGEADAPPGTARPPADDAHPGARCGHPEGVRRGRPERLDAEERSRWPG
jgi:hypothetical protein